MSKLEHERAQLEKRLGPVVPVNRPTTVVLALRAPQIEHFARAFEEWHRRECKAPDPERSRRYGESAARVFVAILDEQWPIPPEADLTNEELRDALERIDRDDPISVHLDRNEAGEIVARWDR